MALLREIIQGVPLILFHFFPFVPIWLWMILDNYDYNVGEFPISACLVAIIYGIWFGNTLPNNDEVLYYHLNFPLVAFSVINFTLTFGRGFIKFLWNKAKKK
jgi:hypothetical protein